MKEVTPSKITQNSYSRVVFHCINYDLERAARVMNEILTVGWSVTNDSTLQEYHKNENSYNQWI